MIFKINFFSILFLLATIGLCQNDNIVLSSNTAIRSIYADSTIYSKKVGNLNLGTSISAANLYYAVKEHDGEYFLFENEEPIISYWSKNQAEITGITVFSKNFQLQNGLRVGSTIEEITKKYDDLLIQKSFISDEELFSIPNGSEKLSLILYLESVDSETIGDYDASSSQITSKKFSHNGIISRIEIIQIY